MDINLISIIAAIVILAIFALVVFVSIKKGLKNDKMAKEFLDGLTDKIQEIILECISSFDPKKYDTIEEFETFLLSDIYEKVWDYVKEEVNVAFNDKLIVKAIVNLINQDYIVKFIDELIEDKGFDDNITNKFLSVNSVGADEVESEDKEMSTEYADQSQYVEESKEEELEPAKDTEPTDAELASLNPQTDEEESYNPEDDSMELITDETTIVSSVSKSGQTLYYEIGPDGKKTRVSKKYVEESGKNVTPM